MTWPLPIGIAPPAAAAAGAVVAVARRPDHLDVFWVGPDGGIGVTSWDQSVDGGRWAKPFPIAPPRAAVPGSIAAVARGAYHLDVFWVGPDGGVGTTSWNPAVNGGRWATPFPIAPPHAAAPGAIAALGRGTDHLDVFWVGPDGGIGTTSWDAAPDGGQWIAPFPIAPPHAAAPGALAAVRRGTDHLDVFWVGPDGGIGTTNWAMSRNDGRWAAPIPIAPPHAAAPGAVAAVARRADHLDVFWVGPDGGVGTTGWDPAANGGRWTKPFPIAPPRAAAPGAVAALVRPGEHLEVYWVGPDGGIGTTWLAPAETYGRWARPFPIAPPRAASAGAVAAVSRQATELAVFWVGPDGGIGTTSSSDLWRVEGPPSAGQDDLDAILRDEMVRLNIRAGSVAVAKGGKTYVKRAYTNVHPDFPTTTPGTTFRIASVSKAFTAAAIQTLFWTPDSLTEHVFPYLGLSSNTNTPADSITVGQCATGRSGLPGCGLTPDVNGNITFREIGMSMGHRPTIQELAVFIYRLPLVTAPGTSTAYSNSAFDVLGAVVEKASGQSFMDYLTHSVTRPMGIYDVHAGATARGQRLAGEVAEYDAEGFGPSEINLAPGATDPNAYGGAQQLETAPGSGGLVTSAESVARFIGSHAVWDLGGRVVGGRLGNFQGTMALAVSVDGAEVGADWDFAILFNRQIDDKIMTAIGNRVEAWLKTHGAALIPV